MLVPGWMFEAPHSLPARRRERLFLARIAARLVNRIDVTGVLPAGAGTLYVSNHISWMDIPILGSALETEFIAKSDVKGWPLIGPLSRRSGTLFVAREERHRVHNQAREIADRLGNGRSLTLFAEGTTSDGITILPFRSSLFEAARQARQIQPIAIGYHGGDGVALSDDQLAAIGWTGDEELLPNLGRVSRLNLAAEVRLAPAFTPGKDMPRKQLAERCEIAVRENYAAIRAAAKRSE